MSDFVPIWLSGNIDCHLSDKTLLACDHDPIGTGVTFCSHSNDIWLNCSSCNKFLCDEGTCVTACDGTKDCAGGEDEDNIACSKCSSTNGCCFGDWIFIMQGQR